jgi:lactate dehydrogenase-like 2-hydroxyacid dehydrogenase
MGGIGRNMARKLRAFGMSVQYYNRHKLSEEMEDGAKYVDFEELLKTSDVISLNLPLNVSVTLSLTAAFIRHFYAVSAPHFLIAGFSKVPTSPASQS